MHEALVILGLILLNGLFASAELALVSARRTRLKGLADQGHRGARTALALLDDPTRLLSSTQVGITLVGILTGVYSGAAYSSELARQLAHYELLRPYAEELSYGTIVGGAEGPPLQAAAQALASGIPGARLAVIAGAGHLSSIDHPAEFFALVTAFLAER